MNILDTIIAHKKIEVAKAKEATSIKSLEESHYFSAPKISLKEYILRDDKSGIIAEFKRKSPSKGIINNTALVEKVTTGYSNAGASALSVLTDTNFFGGSNEDAITARKANTIPILRKDFTIDEYQIIEAKAIGANAILLIAAVLTKTEIKQFTTLAHNLGLEVLLEIHTQEELDKYIPEISVVGINNRNLKTFEVDFENAIRLAKELPINTVKIAESGISDYKNIDYLRTHGFDGFLIGENFMKTENPAIACQDFIEKIKRTTMLKLKVCGMRNSPNITELIEIRPDFIGFIFHEKSPRNVSEIMLENTPKNISRVGVFVNKSVEFIKEKKDQYNLDYIQLHGSETPEFCNDIKNIGIGIIKAFNITKDYNFSNLKDYESHCDYFLFDAFGRNAGGNGITFNWDLLNNYKGEIPFLLSGGIDETMVDSIKKIKHPQFTGIDINSGFETEPALKNIEKIKTFKNELYR